MNFKAYFVVIIALTLSACGHLRSGANNPETPPTASNDEVSQKPIENTTLPSPLPAPDVNDTDDTQVPETSLENSANEAVSNGNGNGIANGTQSASGTTTLYSAPLQTDIMERLRRGFRFPDLTSKYVGEYERWDASHPTYLNNLFNRATPFLYYIVEELDKRNLPMELALLPAIESAYKPNAISRSSAGGLWQFIPSTGKHFGLRQDWWYDGRRDVILSTTAALDYLTQLNSMFNGDWFLTLAAYNAGPGTVMRAIKANKRKGKSTLYSDIKLRSETRRYIPKLIALKNIINDPQKYNIDLPFIANEPQFEVVSLPGQVDLNQLAESANIKPALLRHLNAGFKRWATSPEGPHRILVPIGSEINSQVTRAAIAQAPQVNYHHHRIASGDTLGQIARRYGVSVHALKTSNNLRSNAIRAGKNLLIPVPAAAQAASGNASHSAAYSDTQGGEKRVVHRVQKGDTLWSIARRYKVQLSQLMSWNKLTKNQILSLDQSLLVFLN